MATMPTSGGNATVNGTAWPAFLGTVRGRCVVVMPLMLAGLWLTFRITASAVLTFSNPALAARLDRGNNRALERQAATLATAMNPASARRAQSLAVRALAASPLSSDAAIMLALARNALDPKADVMPAVAYSEFLSRRSPLTEIFLIEHWSSRGDIPRTLRAYDHLFRSNDTYRVQFLPVLLSSTTQPEIAHAMAQLLESQPPWRMEYFGGLLGTFPGAVNFAILAQAMHFNLAEPDEEKLFRLTLSRLVDAGRPDLAFILYRHQLGAKAAANELVRNGNFDQSGGFPPFDWEMTQTDELSAEVGSDAAGRPALVLINRGGRAGRLARQLLMLRPGSYRLTFNAGNVTGQEADRPRITIRCLTGEQDLTSMRLPSAPEAGRQASLAIDIPAQRCAAQWLVIEAGNPIDDVEGQQWIGGLRIIPVAISRSHGASAGAGDAI